MKRFSFLAAFVGLFALNLTLAADNLSANAASTVAIKQCVCVFEAVELVPQCWVLVNPECDNDSQCSCP